MSLSNLIRQCSHLRNTVRTLHGNGIRAWFCYIYYALFRKNKFIILQANLEEPLKELQEPLGVTLLWSPLSKLEALRSNRMLPREFYCNQFQEVDNCMLALIDGNPAYIHWVYFEGEFSRFLKIGPDSVEINYVITMPEYRGRGISAAAFKSTLQILKKRGLKRVFAVVHEENIASIKSFARAGFVEVGTTVSYGQFNKKIAV